MHIAINFLVSFVYSLRLASSYPQPTGVPQGQTRPLPYSGVKYLGLACKTPHNKTNPYEGPGMMEVYNYAYPHQDARNGYDTIDFDAFLERAAVDLDAARAEGHSDWGWPLPGVRWYYFDSLSGLAILVVRGSEGSDWARALSYQDVRQIIDALRLRWTADLRFIGWKMPSASFILAIDDFPDSVVPIRMAVGSVGIGIGPKNIISGFPDGNLLNSSSNVVEIQ